MAGFWCGKQWHGGVPARLEKTGSFFGRIRRVQANTSGQRTGITVFFLGPQGVWSSPGRCGCEELASALPASFQLRKWGNIRSFEVSFSCHIRPGKTAFDARVASSVYEKTLLAVRSESCHPRSSAAGASLLCQAFLQPYILAQAWQRNAVYIPRLGNPPKNRACLEFGGFASQLGSLSSGLADDTGHSLSLFRLWRLAERTNLLRRAGRRRFCGCQRPWQQPFPGNSWCSSFGSLTLT